MKTAVIAAAVLTFAVPAAAQTCDAAKQAEIRSIAETLQSRNEPNIVALLGRWNFLLDECLSALPRQFAKTPTTNAAGDAAKIGADVVSGATLPSSPPSKP